MSKLFTPITVGPFELAHRVAMAPLTRFRAKDNVVLPIVKGWFDIPSGKNQTYLKIHRLTRRLEYYAQRASTPGTLLISEATPISPGAGVTPHAPGIWEPDHITAWKEVTDAVHAKGSKIFCQLWHLGRAGDPEALAAFGLKLKSASSIAMHSNHQVPEELTEDEIWEVISEYVVAAQNAISGAGFDGVEIHGANGYLPDQFLQDVTNKRNDKWGGSIENRSRFHLEIARAVAKAVGADRVGMRLSPHGVFCCMGMEDPVPQFSHLVGELKKMGLAYLHFVEGRVSGAEETTMRTAKSNDPFIKIWDNASPILLAGGFTPASAAEAVDELYKDFDVVIVFGRHFIANPDLVYRLRRGIPINSFDRATFYVPHTPEGYVDYPFCEEFVQETGGVRDEVSEKVLKLDYQDVRAAA